MPDLTAEKRAAQFAETVWERVRNIHSGLTSNYFHSQALALICDAEAAQRERADLLEVRYEDSRKLNQKLESNFLAERYKTGELEKELGAIRRAGEVGDG